MRNKLKNRLLLIAYTVTIILILMIFMNYQIRISDDIYRHYSMLYKMKIRNNLIDVINYYNRDYGNFIFYLFIYLVKYYSLPKIIIPIIIGCLYYFSAFFLLKNCDIKIKNIGFYMIISFVFFNPFYVLTLLHYPLAISFISIAIYLKKHKVIKYTFLILAYYTHTGTSYIIVLFILSKLRIVRKNIFNFKRSSISLVALFILLYLFPEILLKISEVSNNVYFRYKIEAYLIRRVASSGAVGLGARLSILYFIFLSFLSYWILLKNKLINKYDEEIAFFYTLLFGSIILGSLNLIFLVRSYYILVVIYPFVLSRLLRGKNSKILVYLKMFILLGCLFIVEYRFLLNL